MMDPRFADEGLMAWLGVDNPEAEQRVLDAMAPACRAVSSSLRKSGLDDRQAAFMVVMITGAVLAAQPSPKDRDRLMVEAILALDRVRDGWAQARPRRGPRPPVQ